ncbi:MAG: hypothetical protein IJO20_07040 [Ruminococcus sp.]|nr:hypothetical protein [Ruminococcus sp.]
MFGGVFSTGKRLPILFLLVKPYINETPKKEIIEASPFKIIKNAVSSKKDKSAEFENKAGASTAMKLMTVITIINNSRITPMMFESLVS